jgi:hypothetical protein
MRKNKADAKQRSRAARRGFAGARSACRREEQGLILLCEFAIFFRAEFKGNWTDIVVVLLVEAFFAPRIIV